MATIFEGHTEFFDEEFDMIIASRALNVYDEQVQEAFDTPNSPGEATPTITDQSPTLPRTGLMANESV